MEEKTLYLECYSGISGDMTVAALLDLGADEKKLRKALASLPLTGYRIEITEVGKSRIRAKDFNVCLDNDNHDHDRDYLYGHAHKHFHEEGHTHDGQHTHEAGHTHEGQHTHAEVHSHDHAHVHAQEEHHHGPHRGMKEIREILSAGALTEGAKERALAIFEVLAKAEAKVHGTTPEEVHFHEVGAVDSIIDIAAIGICLDDLGITKVITPVLYEGEGTVRCQHGILPIPVPAVAEIVSAYRIPLHRIGLQGEFVTPTGAATVAAMTTAWELPETYRMIRVGIGAGKREYEGPGILRAILIQEQEKTIGRNTQEGE